MTDLEQRISGYTRNAEQMRLANRYLRSGDDDALMAIGYTPEQIERLKIPDTLGHIGFPPVLLKRTNQKIYVLKKRRASMVAAEALQKEPT